MKVLSGDEPASAGSFSIAKRARVGVLRQDRFLDDGELILDLAMKGDAQVWNALSQQKALEEGTLTLAPARMAEPPAGGAAAGAAASVPAADSSCTAVAGSPASSTMRQHTGQ